MSRYLFVVITMMGHCLFAGLEFKKVPFSVNEWDGGAELGTRQILWGKIFDGNRKGCCFHRSLGDCGDCTFRSLLRMPSGLSFGIYRMMPIGMSIDGSSFKVYSVMGYGGYTNWMGSAEMARSHVKDLESFIETSTKDLGLKFWASRFPVSDEDGSRRWVALFEDVKNRRCVLDLTCKARKEGRELPSELGGGMSYDDKERLYDNEDVYHYERHIEYSTYATITVLDYMSDELRSSFMRDVEEFVAEAEKPFSVGDLYASVKDCIVLISDARKSIATGFIGRSGGQVYLYTNRHVAQPHFKNTEDERLFAKTPNGSVGSLGRLWVPIFAGGEYDVARYELCLTRCKAIELDEDVDVKLNDKVYIFGNSGAEGVLTSIEGKVLGVGKEKIEVDAKFVAGNSGSPVFNNKGQVIGIVSYIQIPNRGKDKEGTRFAERRYFISRLNMRLVTGDMLGDWLMVSRDKTNEECSWRRDLSR